MAQPAVHGLRAAGGADVRAVLRVRVAGAVRDGRHPAACPTDQFGLYYLFLASGFFIGNLLVSRSGGHHDVDAPDACGPRLATAWAPARALALVLLGFAHPLAVFVPMMMFSFGQGLALPNLIAHGIRLAPNYTGVASSIFGFSQLALSAVAVQIMGYVPAHGWQPALWFCVIGAAILRRRRSPSRSANVAASAHSQARQAAYTAPPVLGRFHEISVETADIAESVAFYERLGFTPVRHHRHLAASLRRDDRRQAVPRPAPVQVSLAHAHLRAPGRRATRARHREARHRSGVETRRRRRLQRIRIPRSFRPGGARAGSRHAFRQRPRRPREPRCAATSPSSACRPRNSSPCASSGSRSASWPWTRATRPYLRMSMTSDHLDLGVHRPRTLDAPMLVFAAADMGERIERLRALGCEFADDLPRGLDPRHSALLEAPGRNGAAAGQRRSTSCPAERRRAAPSGSRTRRRARRANAGIIRASRSRGKKISGDSR